MRPVLVVNGRIPHAAPQPQRGRAAQSTNGVQSTPGDFYVPGDRIVFLKTLQEGAITQILRLKDGAARYAIVRFDSGDKLIAAFRELRPCADETAT